MIHSYIVASEADVYSARTNTVKTLQTVIIFIISSYWGDDIKVSALPQNSMIFKRLFSSFKISSESSPEELDSDSDSD